MPYGFPYALALIDHAVDAAERGHRYRDCSRKIRRDAQSARGRGRHLFRLGDAERYALRLILQHVGAGGSTERERRGHREERPKRRDFSHL